MSSKDPDIDAAHTKDSTGHGLFDEKKVVSEKRYIIPSRESIRMMAEAEGVTNLTDDGALTLSEDLSYRLREIVQNSLEYMKHAKRRRLTTEDINDALRTSDMQPILGHGSPEPVTFKQVKDADIHFVEDVDLSVANIASNSYKPKETGELGIKSFWYAIEGVSKIIPVPAVAGETWKTPSFGQRLHAMPGNPVGKPVIVKKEKKELSENMLRYYDYMVKAILGADEEAMKFALSDLKTNSKIVPLLPYFVNFVSNGVKTVSHDISQLTRLLHTVKALTNNSNLYLEPEPYLGLLVQSVMYCGLEPLAASINPLNDHWVLRDYAARLLGHIVKKWSVHNSALMQNTLKSLKEVICDLSKPFCSHYGAVMGLLALGTKAVENVLLPELQIYMQHLTNFLEDTSLTNALLRTDANKVSGAILLAAEYVMKNLLQNMDLQTPSPSPNIGPKQPILSPAPSFPSVKTEPESSLKFEQMPNMNADILRQRTAKDIYSELYDYFGDMLSSKLPIMELPVMELPIMELQHIYGAKKPEKLVKLYETNVSGEHLWNSMHARFVAEIAKEHEEEERLAKEQRRERERLEQEQRERERLERERLKKEQAENAEKQKRYHPQHSEKFWQSVQTEDEAEDSDNANDVDNMESSDNTNSEEEDDDESEEEEMEDDDDEEEEEEDEEEEEEEEESDDDTDSDKETLAVARTVTNPEAGIKLVITKIQPKVHIHKGEKESKGKSETSSSSSSQRTDRHKECKVSKKKKQNERSNKYNSRMYCKEEESSSNGRKLTIRLRRSENPQNPKTNSR